MSRFLCLLVILGITGVGCEKRFVAKSNSMVPTIAPGDLVKVRSIDGKPLRRYDIIAFHPGFSPTSTFVMRIVGLPGETIRCDQSGLHVNGRAVPKAELPPVLAGQSFEPAPEFSANPEWGLGAQQVFVVGDNLSNARDSRYWGPLSTSNIIGFVSSIGKR